MTGTYEKVSDNFSWDQAWDAFEGNLSQLNMGHEVIGKHSKNERTAVKIIDFDSDSAEEVSFADLNDLASQFANFLRNIGLTESDIVASSLDCCTELYVTITGTWLSGSTYLPLSPLFGSDAIDYRLTDSEPKVLVTTRDHLDTLEQHDVRLPEHVITIGNGQGLTFEDVYEESMSFVSPETSPDDLSTVVYTSGTSGNPSIVPQFQMKVVSLYPYMEYAAGLRTDDVYFSTASPSWSYGLFESTAYALHKGTGLITYRGKFDSETFIRAVNREDTTNLFASPTVFRQLPQLDVEWDSFDFDLRQISCAGEPIDKETQDFTKANLGADIRNHYGFTESVAGLVVNNYAFDDWVIKRGSMGKPLPGATVDVFALDADEPVPPGDVGELILQKNPPIELDRVEFSEQVSKKFSGEWFRTGDLVKVNSDGYFWFEGRKDDIILSAGYRIGPREVEDCLMSHRAVKEVAVIGLPDRERGEIVASYVIPADGYSPSQELAKEIKNHVKETLSKHEYPRKVEFVESLPKTESGKIQREQLRNEYANGE